MKYVKFMLVGGLLFILLAQIQPKNPLTTTAATIVKAESAVAEPAPSVPQFGRTRVDDQRSVCKNAHTGEHYTGENAGSDEVRYWASKYWSGQDLEIAVALTVPEGQRDLYCIGDETPPYYGQPTGDGRHYGYSIGLYQWRTVIEQTGKGGCEDWQWQAGNIERQTDCAFQKWNVKKSWRPWTAYTKNRYQKWLGK